MWAPRPRVVRVNGVMQAVKVAPSREQANVAHVSLVEKVKVAKESVVAAAGPESIIVSGGVVFGGVLGVVWSEFGSGSAASWHAE